MVSGAGTCGIGVAGRKKLIFAGLSLSTRSAKECRCYPTVSLRSPPSIGQPLKGRRAKGFSHGAHLTSFVVANL